MTIKLEPTLEMLRQAYSQGLYTGIGIGLAVATALFVAVIVWRDRQ